uniref:EF-hand domain-containing protein n=1 Tax=Palpitomonas bilix TaxID=652834 RepID=A0A7S3GLC1_9EUKA|mmetsp:Transcript_8561/g.22917  ORF Transcript_8561/g.22917 Transcript_8561/m.22917 type:complete len:714 (+) Transcript_8561:161-2302(+)
MGEEDYLDEEEIEDLEKPETPAEKGPVKKEDVPDELIANKYWKTARAVTGIFGGLQLLSALGYTTLMALVFVQPEYLDSLTALYVALGAIQMMLALVAIIGVATDHLSSFVFVEEMGITIVCVGTMLGGAALAYTNAPTISEIIFAFEMEHIHPSQICGKDWAFCLNSSLCPQSVSGCYAQYNSTLFLGYNTTLPSFLQLTSFLPSFIFPALLGGAFVFQVITIWVTMYVKGLSCARRSKDSVRVRASLDHNQVVVPVKWRKMVIDEIRAMIAEVGIEVKDIFEMFDKDKNGTLSIAEFKNAIQQMNLPLEKRHIVELYRSIDVNEAGGISYTEFCDKLLPENWQEEILHTIKKTIDRYGMSLKEAFVALADGKRHIPVPRFRQILHEMKTGLSPYHVNVLVKKIDADQNDYVSVDEFLDMFLHDEWKRDVVEAFRKRMAEKGSSALEVFASFDVDGNGTISRDEFRAAMDRLGIDLSHRHYDTLMEDVDKDGDGVISYDEFVATFAPQASNARITSFEQLLRALRDMMVSESVTIQDAFDVFDKDQDGSISRDEFRRAIGRLLFDKVVSPALVDTLMEQMDLDQDDRVSFEEFRNYMRSALGKKGSHLVGSERYQPSPATSPTGASANLDHALEADNVRSESQGMSATLSSNIEALYNAFSAQDRQGSGMCPFLSTHPPPYLDQSSHATSSLDHPPKGWHEKEGCGMRVHVV